MIYIDLYCTSPIPNLIIFTGLCIAKFLNIIFLRVRPKNMVAGKNMVFSHRYWWWIFKQPTQLIISIRFFQSTCFEQRAGNFLEINKTFTNVHDFNIVQNLDQLTYKYAPLFRQLRDTADSSYVAEFSASPTTPPSECLYGREEQRRYLISPLRATAWCQRAPGSCRGRGSCPALAWTPRSCTPWWPSPTSGQRVQEQTWKIKEYPLEIFFFHFPKVKQTYILVHWLKYLRSKNFKEVL